jgi:hypothetical protein
MTSPSFQDSKKGIILWGALLGFAAALCYGFLYSLYAILRSSLQIAYVLTPMEGLAGALAANAFSILVSGFVFALIFSIPAFLIEGGTTILIINLLPVYNPSRSPVHAISLGGIIAALFVAGISVLVRHATVDYPAFFPHGYTAWVGIPCLIFILLNSWISWRINADSI